MVTIFKKMIHGSDIYNNETAWKYDRQILSFRLDRRSKSSIFPLPTSERLSVERSEKITSQDLKNERELRSIK